MATTTLATASQVQKWRKKYFMEYTRASGFRKYMGQDMNLPIQLAYELTSGGKTVNVPFIARLTGSPVTGSNTLVGNEEALNNYNMAVTVDWKRWAVEIKKPELHWTEMDLMNAAGKALKYRSADALRDDIIAGFQSIWTGTASVAYGSATEAQKDAWLDNNIDRVLFGAAKSNVSTSAPAGGATYDHSASLANVDGSGDKLTKERISLMKRIAKTADPHIQPVRVDDSSGREYFIAFCNTFTFRDLKADLLTVNTDARPRGMEDHPIFQDGDLMYDGVVIREIPEIPVISGAGAASIDVAPVFFCGAQALALAWGQEPQMKRKAETDYEFAQGRAIEECRGIEKIVYNNKDHGLVTGFFASVADA